MEERGEVCCMASHWQQRRRRGRQVERVGMGQAILAWLHEHGGLGRLRQIDAGVNLDRPGAAGECIRSKRAREARELAGINAAIRVAQQAIQSAKRRMAAFILIK